MRLSGRSAKVRLHLDPAEVGLLESLFGELDEIVADTEDTDVGRRLYPDALPDDAAASGQFRELTEESLRNGRRERIAACRADLAHQPVALGGDGVSTRWLQVLNDLRLVLGTRLGVTDDGVPEPDGTADDASVSPHLVYDWLTGVQDLIVRSVMGR